MHDNNLVQPSADLPTVLKDADAAVSVRALDGVEAVGQAVELELAVRACARGGGGGEWIHIIIGENGTNLPRRMSAGCL